MLSGDTGLVHVRYAGRAEGVVIGAEDAVRARMAPLARVAAALAGTMAGSAGDGIVAGQLLIPEQDLAQHPLGLGDRVLGGDRHGRQGGEGDRRGKARQPRPDQHPSTDPCHLFPPPVARPI